MDEEWLVDPVSSHNLFITYPHTSDEYLYPNIDNNNLYSTKSFEKNNNTQSSFTNENFIDTDNLIMILLTILIIFSSLIYSAILNIDKKLKLLLYKKNNGRKII